MSKEFRIESLENDTKKLVIENTREDGEKDVREIVWSRPEKVSFATCEAAKTYMDAQRPVIDQLCDAWVEAHEIGNGITSRIEDEVDELVKLWNMASIDEAFRDCLEAKEPLYRAAERQLYPTLSSAVRNLKGTEEKRLQITERNKRIPIDRLRKHRVTIGHDPDWYYTVQSVNKLFTARAIAADKDVNAVDILKEIDDSFAMDEIAKRISLGENPASNTKLLEHLRKIIGQMLGDEYVAKVTSHDVRHINELYLTEYKKDPTGMTKEAATNKRFYDLVLIVAHRVVSGGSYSTYSKELDRKKK